MKVNIDTDIRVDIPEHQVLLSFNNDEDAVNFNEWWNRRGLEAFAEYMENLSE